MRAVLVGFLDGDRQSERGDFLELFGVHADRDSREWIWWLIGEWLAFHFHGLLLV